MKGKQAETIWGQVAKLRGEGANNKGVQENLENLSADTIWCILGALIKEMNRLKGTQSAGAHAH